LVNPAAATVPALLRRSAALLSEHLAPLAATAAVIQFPVTALLALTVPSLPVGAFGHAGRTAVLRAVTGLIEVYPVVALAQLAMLGALVVAVTDAAAGRTPEPTAAYRRVLLSLRGLVLTGCLIGALVFTALLLGSGLPLGIAFLALPALAAAVLWSLAVQVVMLEGVTLAAALRRSARLVRRRFGRAAGLLVALAALQLVVAAAGELPYAVSVGGAAQVASEALGALLTVTVGLLPVVALTLLYMDLVEEERAEAADPPAA
jgi:hypothetical protein